MLKRLYLDNYRSFVNFECRLGSAQLVLGPNGTGKSTLFDVLSLLRNFCVVGQAPDDDEVKFVGNTRTRWQDSPVQSFELDVSGNGGEYAFRLAIDSWGNPLRPRVISEELDFSGKPVFRFTQGEVHLFNDRHEDKVQYPFDWHRSALATITERRDNTKLSWFKRWLGGFVCIRPDPRRMSALAEKESILPDADLANFANWYRHLRQEGDSHTLLGFLKDLEHAIEGFASLDLKDAGLGNRILKVALSSNGETNTAKRTDHYQFDELSDGQRVLIGLYTVLHFALKSEATVAFDEPDNYIALHEVQPWLGKVLERVEDSHTQVLIVSHHPELLNRMAFQNGLLLDRPGARHTRVRRFSDTSQTGLSPAELVTRGWDRE